MRTIAGCADAKRQHVDWLSSKCWGSLRREPSSRKVEVAAVESIIAL